MKKAFVLIAALLLSGTFANEAAAQYPPPGAMPPQAGFAPSPYGWHPSLQRLAAKHGSDRCGRPNLLSRLFAPAPSGGVAEGGTLVFPNHPFARSPRDFFMLDQ